MVTLILVLAAGGVWLVVAGVDRIGDSAVFDDQSEPVEIDQPFFFCTAVGMLPPAQALLNMETGSHVATTSILLSAYSMSEIAIPRRVTQALDDFRKGAKRVTNGEPAVVVQQELQPQITTIEKYAATVC